jgi:hypothetical protein
MVGGPEEAVDETPLLLGLLRVFQEVLRSAFLSAVAHGASRMTEGLSL